MKMLTLSNGIAKMETRPAIWLIATLVILTIIMATPEIGRTDQSDERLEELFNRLKTAADPLAAGCIKARTGSATVK
jgi:hypothetical protein